MYRRRRLAALLLALLVVGAIVAGVWLLVAQPWQSDSSAEPRPSTSSPAPSPSASADTQPSPSVEPSEPTGMDSLEGETEAPPTVEACTQRELLVEAITDKSDYAAGEEPRLSIRLTNQSDEACTLNVGTAKQVYTVTSGSDTWWRSTDCQTEPADQVVTLAAGQVVESAEPLVWDRTRSAVSTCDSDRQAAPGGGASYHLEVSIGGVRSMESRQFFLN